MCKLAYVHERCTACGGTGAYLPTSPIFPLHVGRGALTPPYKAAGKGASAVGAHSICARQSAFFSSPIALRTGSSDQNLSTAMALTTDIAIRMTKSSHRYPEMCVSSTAG